MRWAYAKFRLDAENLPGKLGGGSVSKNVGNVANDIGAVGEGHWGISGSADDDLTLVKVPAEFATFTS